MGRHRSPDTVVCIACGAVVAREQAREYDRMGDRWERAGKRFEFLCKPCHVLECHLPRAELEDTLEAVGSEHDSPGAFVTAYYQAVRAEGGGEERPKA